METRGTGVGMLEVSGSLAFVLLLLFFLHLEGLGIRQAMPIFVEIKDQKFGCKKRGSAIQ